MSGLIELKKSIPGKLLTGSVFLMPFFQTGTIACWIVLGLYRLLDKSERELMRSRLLFNGSHLWLIAYYAVLLIGLLNTSNFKSAVLDLQIKLSFLLVPLIIGTLSDKDRNLGAIKTAFIAGTGIACVVSWINGLTGFYHDHETRHLFYSDLGKLIMHPTYFSMYINLALLFMVDKNASTALKSIRIIEVLLFLLFMATLAFLSARMALFTAFSSILTYMIFLYRKGRVSRNGMAGYAGIMVSGIFFIFLAEGLTGRMGQLSAVVENENQQPSDSAYNSTSGRMEIWRESLQLLPSHWITGTGTGDIKDELMKQYARNGFEYGFGKKLNPHNQFLQTWLAHGLAGIFVLIAIFIHPLMKRRYSSDLLLLPVLLIFFLNGLTESVFEVQKGVLLFSSFYCLLAVNRSSIE